MTRSAAIRTPEDAAAVRKLPYGRQLIEADDVFAVLTALQSDYLAHGPRVTEFEQAFAATVGAAEAVACSSGTAALQLALRSLDVGPGDVCIVPAITFLSTATAALLCGAEVAFADVDPDSGLMIEASLADALQRAPGSKAVLPVHLAGRLCDMPALSSLARKAGAAVVEDACHAVGGVDADGRPVGACAHSDAAVFSFHPVKTLAAGEGGMVTLNYAARAERMRRLRNHGVSRDPALMSEPDSFEAEDTPNPWAYEQLELGFNLRMDEISAALGLSQLRKLDRFVARRAALAARYDRLLQPLSPLVRPAPASPGKPGLHLHTVLIDFEAAGVSRAQVMRALSDRGIGTQVHYIPLYRQPWFKARYGEMRLPGSEAYYARVLALPLYPAMDDEDVDRIVEALGAILPTSSQQR
jgi:UDP-4-amino-4,6-dideoxy-N-acetyl-beta-L-altrosamine transaminase